MEIPKERKHETAEVLNIFDVPQHHPQFFKMFLNCRIP